MSAPIEVLDRPPWWPREHSDECIEGRTYDGKTTCDCDEWLVWVKQIRSHPAYAELFERYKKARKQWLYMRSRLLIPMDSRHYCDAYVNHWGPITWEGNHVWTNGAVMPFDMVVDRAWEDSGKVPSSFRDTDAYTHMEGRS